MLRLSPRDQFRGPGLACLATAYFVTGEYEKTLEYMTMALRSQPHLLWLALVIQVAALALLDRDAQATKARDDLLSRYPRASISNIPNGVYVSCWASVIEGLRKVEFPE